MTTREILLGANDAKRALALADPDTKNRLLLAMAERLLARTPEILQANEADMAAARGQIGEVMLDRLRLDESRIEGMAEGIRQVAALPDPVGRELYRVERPNGMVIRRVSVPMGVIAIIYESRPNVTSDAAALALKSGSACVLRGGKESHRSCAAIVSALREGVRAVGLPETCVSLIEDTGRDSARELMTANGLVDLLIHKETPQSNAFPIRPRPAPLAKSEAFMRFLPSICSSRTLMYPPLAAIFIAPSSKPVTVPGV